MYDKLYLGTGFIRIIKSSKVLFVGNLFVSLFEEKRPDIHIQIYARINEKLDLVIEGADTGILVRELRGESDYEYYLTVEKDSKKLLISKLRDKNYEVTDDKDLLTWIKANFSDNSTFSAFRLFLEQEEVPFKTFFWR